MSVVFLDSPRLSDPTFKALLNVNSLRSGLKVSITFHKIIRMILKIHLHLLEPVKIC